MGNIFMFNKYLLKACLAAVLALGLAACSSSSDNGTGDTSPPTATEQELETLKRQIAALREQLGIDDTADIGSTVAELQDTLKELRNAADKMAMDAAAKEALALFNGFADAEGDGNADLVLGVLTVTDKHGGSAEVSATGAVNTPAVKATDTSVPMLAGMWKGTELAGDTDGKMPSNTVVIYTDIDAPEPVDFGEVYTLTDGLFGGTTGAADAWLQHTANRSKIMASDFVHTGMKDHGADATADDNVNVVIRGTFNGAAGEYRCTAASAGDCVSHDAGDGAVRLAGTWVFDPDSGAKAMQADTVYAYFGWWLRKAGGTVTPEVVAFQGMNGGTAIDAGDFQGLGGTATYTGAAAGKYAINPGLSTASGGHWTAATTLTADFGTDGTGNGTISGMIDSFMAGGEMMDWSVALGETALSNTGGFDTATDTSGDTADNAVVWTVGGVDGAESGTWSGALREAGDNNVPTLATGMFSATHGTVGHIVGAFGADLE